MALIELKCNTCGHRAEYILKCDGAYPSCPKCGQKLMQTYSGKLYVNSAKKGDCNGNCATCKGCSK